MAARPVVYYEFVKDANIPNNKPLPICKIVLNSSNGVHSLTPALVQALLTIFKELEQNEQCLGYILTANTASRKTRGKRPIFSSGLDLKTLNCGDTTKIVRYLLSISMLWKTLHSLQKPLIGAINGDAIAGGCQLSFTCDYRVSFKSIQFAMPETAIGLPIQHNVTLDMNRVIGNQHKTAYFLQTGIALRGERAKEFNIVDKFVEEDGNDQMLIKEAVNVLMNEYFYSKGIKLEKKIKCAATARLNGRQPLLDALNDIMSGKKSKKSRGSNNNNAYVGLKGMTNKKKNKSKL